MKKLLPDFPAEPDEDDLEKIRNALKSQYGIPDEPERSRPGLDQLDHLDKTLVENSTCKDLPSKTYNYCDAHCHYKRRWNSMFNYWFWAVYEKCPLWGGNIEIQKSRWK